MTAIWLAALFAWFLILLTGFMSSQVRGLFLLQLSNKHLTWKT